MRSLIAGCVVVLLARCVHGASKAEKVSPIAPEVQLVSKDLVARGGEKALLFLDAWWPTDLDSHRVNSAQIPQEVFARTSTWLRTMVKSEWLPEDPNGWMIGVQKEAPRKGDYLILRYQIGAVRIQIQENGAAASVLIDTGAFAETKPEAFLTAVTRKFLRYPQDKLGSLEFHMESFEREGRSFYHGWMDCDFDRYDREAYLKRTWYNHTDVWTDGRRVFFSLVEKDGRPAKRIQIRPGLSKRFKPAE